MMVALGRGKMLWLNLFPTENEQAFFVQGKDDFLEPRLIGA
jgi:hypothetical protein